MALFFRASNGRIVVHPGGVTVVDATGGLQAGISLTGIVGIIGTASDGEPWTRPDGKQGPIVQIDDPNDARPIFGFGPLPDAIKILFNPSGDPRIAGGAFRVLAIKLNRSTRSVVDLLVNTEGTLPVGATPGTPPAATTKGFVRLWSRIWGPESENLRVALVTDAQPGVVPAGSPPGTPPVFEVVTSFYLETTFKSVKEQSPVFRLPHVRALGGGLFEYDPGDSVFSLHYGGATASDLALGVVTARQTDGTYRATALTFLSPTIFPSFPAKTLTVRLAPSSTAPPAGTIVAGTYRQLFALVGPMLGAAYSFVPTDPAMNVDRPWSDLDGLPSAADAAKTSPDRRGTFDIAPAAPRRDVAFTNLVSRFAGWINDNSRFLVAEPSADQVVVSRDPSHLMYLPRTLQGEDGLHHANDANWYFDDLEEALDALLQVRVNEVVPLISDPADLPATALGAGDTTGENTLLAVHLAARDHTRESEWPYKSERNAFIGADVPFAKLKTWAAKVGDRNVSVCGQGVTVVDAQGVIKPVPAWAMACVAAGMQAGSPIGEPLTFKFGNVLGISQKNNSWSPRNISHSNALLQAGVLFMEPVDGRGFRFVRDLTTYVFDANLVFTDRNVNEAVNTVSYELRTELENRFTGSRALPATVGAMREAAVGKLEALRDAGVIVDSFDEATGRPLYAYRDLAIVIRGDTAFVKVTVSPVTGINYIEITQVIQLPVLKA